MTGITGLNSTNNPYLALLNAGTNGAQGNSSVGATGSAGSNGGQNTASISPFGQLLSSLQQLQSSNPAQFQQLVTQIAGQLQTAAQQQGQTGAGQLLTNLANQFQNIANGGSLTQLHPHHGHHGHHAHQTYNQQGQIVSSSSTTDTQTSATDSIQQLLSTIGNEVKQAVAG